MRTGRRPERMRDSESDAGSITVENVIILPLVLLFIFGVIQGGLWMHGQNVAHRAASSAYQEARVHNGDAGAAQAHALEMAEGAGLRSPGVTVAKDRDSVRVTVTGSAQTFVPGWGGPSVSAEVSGPTERWSTP